MVARARYSRAHATIPTLCHLTLVIGLAGQNEGREREESGVGGGFGAQGRPRSDFAEYSRRGAAGAARSGV